jgi:hypothetical protein
MFLVAQTEQEKLPEFEVASAKPIDRSARNSIDLKFLSRGRLVITAASVTQLIAAAYSELQLYQNRALPGFRATPTTLKPSLRKTTTTRSPQ